MAIVTSKQGEKVGKGKLEPKRKSSLEG